MIGRIETYIPFAYSFAGLSYNKTRQVGFSFNNHATLILAQNIGIELSKLQEWAKENKTLHFMEMMFAAYISHCRETYQKPKVTKQKLIEGLNRLPEDELKKIVAAWNDSVSIGAKEITKKKR
jgi:hypothetical protein